VGIALLRVVALLVPKSYAIAAVALTGSVMFATQGGVASRIDGAPFLSAVKHVVVWGDFAVRVTTSVCHLFGTRIG